MTLEISPEHLPVISAQLTCTEVTLTSIVGEWAAAAVPLPAAADDVSRWAVTQVAPHGVDCGRAIVPGLEALSQGAQTLIPVSADYAASDVAGGSVVGCQTTNFTR